MKRKFGASLLVLVAAFSPGCGRQERSVVDQFFSASRLRDKTAIQKVATVIFEPLVQGIVERFEITSVGAEEGGAKTVTVSAQVKLPDGRMVQKTIVLTMTRGRITGFLDAGSLEVSPAPRPQ